jgi:serine O-acetyltransferase
VNAPVDARPRAPGGQAGHPDTQPTDARPATRFARYRYLVLSDLYRITGKVRAGALPRWIIAGESFRYNFWLRTCQYAGSGRWLKYTVYPVARLMHRHLSYRLGIFIPPGTRIGSGFYIGHPGGIVVNRNSVIGKNCNISHGVTLGQANRGRNRGCPTVGDNVYIGPGAVIVGKVRIGNNVAVGANCVVTRDVPDNSVVVGVPGRVISQAGAADYVNRTDYEGRIS